MTVCVPSYRSTELRTSCPLHVQLHVQIKGRDYAATHNKPTTSATQGAASPAPCAVYSSLPWALFGISHSKRTAWHGRTRSEDAWRMCPGRSELAQLSETVRIPTESWRVSLRVTTSLTSRRTCLFLLGVSDLYCTFCCRSTT